MKNITPPNTLDKNTGLMKRVPMMYPATNVENREIARRVMELTTRRSKLFL